MVMLGKRGDELQRLEIARPLPVRKELIAVERYVITDGPAPGSRTARRNGATVRDDLAAWPDFLGTESGWARPARS